MTDAFHPIRLVARLTGLSPAVIRVWEQRHRAVAPPRTATNRRQYSAEDIERLNLLRAVTQAGHGIGEVAQLPVEKLRQLAAQVPGTNGRRPGPAAATPARPVFLDDCLAAIQDLDAPALDHALKHGATALGTLGLLQRVVAPLAQSLGDRWRDGTFTAAHEHFATAALRTFLGTVAGPFGAMDHAPVLLVATPAGQVHELGALLAGAVAANLGWRVVYLGASLPAAEIAGAARQTQARAVALSLVYPEDDPRLEGELRRLRELLPAETPLLAGGRAVAAYRKVLVRLGAVLSADLVQLGAALDRLRHPIRKGKP